MSGQSHKSTIKTLVFLREGKETAFSVPSWKCGDVASGLTNLDLGWWEVGVWCVGGEREVASMSVSRIQGHGERGERRLDIHPSNTVKDA